MQLVEAGKIDLDADIRTYVPEFPDKGEKITARHILSHTSGIRHYKPDESENYTRHASVVDGLKHFTADPLLHKPGEKLTYSTYVFSLLARAVETTSGLTFKEYLDQRIFEPAGMKASGLEDLAPSSNTGPVDIDGGQTAAWAIPIFRTSATSGRAEEWSPPRRTFAASG